MTDGTAKADAGRRYRLYPTPSQAGGLTGWAHTCRAVWNVALEQRQFAWSQRRYTMRAMEQNRHLTQARAEVGWMADLPAQSAQQVLRHLDAAYDAAVAALKARQARRRLDSAPGTSQTCSACHVRDPESRPGCGREFACTACGRVEHADRNAALVIEQRAAGQAGPEANLGPASTRSHPRVARPRQGSRMREPVAGAA